MFYRAIDGGFYDPSIHGVVPEDAVEILDSDYLKLLKGQEQGKRIVPDQQGFPMLADPPPLSVEELGAIERKWRDDRLAETDGVVTRHRDELEEDVETTLSTEQYVELQAYRRELRRWPEAGGFPLADRRPSAPEWLVNLAQ